MTVDHAAGVAVAISRWWPLAVTCPNGNDPSSTPTSPKRSTTPTLTRLRAAWDLAKALEPKQPGRP